jgi:hypothetical protein
MEEIEVWYSEYELGQFIDMALRWSIEGIYKDRTEARPFSVFTNKVENARANYDKFCSQLNKKLTQNPNWKAIELDLNQKFLPMLNQYLQWYETNKKEFEKFQPYCPYTLMLTIIESTKQEIIKYFPEIANQYLNNMDSFEQLFAKAEIHGLIEQNIVSDELDYYRKKQSLAALRHNDLNMFSNEFSVWLQDIKYFAFKDQFEYLQFCKEETTFNLFVEFIHYRKSETKKNIAERAKETAQKARYSLEQIIAMEILGIMEYGENNYNPIQPVFHYIPIVLNKHKLSPKEAIFYLRTYSGSFQPIINTNLKPKVIEYLQSLIDLDYKFTTEPTDTQFINNFDKIEPTEIYNHFKAGLVDKGYLTNQELNEYLRAAFELKTIPEILFKIKDAPNKAAIEAVFYKYYKNVAGKIHGKQAQYAALLGNYFEGYKTTTISSNFSKSVY